MTRTGTWRPGHPSLAYEWYQNQVRSWLQTNRPGQELADVPYTGTVTEESLGLLPASLPHEAMAFTGEWSELPETLRHRYQITLLRGGTSVLNRTLRAVETSLSRVTLSYQASKESAALVDALGGARAQAFLASLTPVLKIDEIVDTSGSTVNTGDWIDIRVRLLFPQR